ncbi:hypothetical protein TSUD_240390 [Trifolium subterraneum]|uniref:Uncharacterized protein n=1 Tax=Trifolium subterraneum TaxID=3900 RepID=A0A2Z6NKR1_TRISU|nr:hypothetical protein TSUD_240390 [Trifolium subterraneum]
MPLTLMKETTLTMEGPSFPSNAVDDENYTRTPFCHNRYCEATYYNVIFALVLLTATSVILYL